MTNRTQAPNLRRVNPPTERRMFTQQPNWIYDLMPALTDAELRYLLDLTRRTVGYHQDTDDSTAAQIAQRTGLKRPTVATTQRRLVALGLVVLTPGYRNGYVRSLGAPATLEDIQRRKRELSAKMTDDVSDEMTDQSANCQPTRQLPVRMDDSSDRGLSAPSQGKTAVVNKREINKNPTTMNPVPHLASAVVPATPSGGGGDSSSRKPHYAETVELFERTGMKMARNCGDIPPDIARAILKDARTAHNPAAAAYGLVKNYRTGTYQPAAETINQHVAPPAAAAPLSVFDREGILSPQEVAARAREMMQRQAVAA